MFLIAAESSNFDSTITISIVLAIVALFAPSVTAFINNRHLALMKRIELQTQIRSDIIDVKRGLYLEYMETLADYIVTLNSSSGNYAAKIEYKKLYGRVLILAEPNSIRTLRVIDEIVERPGALSSPERNEKAVLLNEKISEIAECLRDELNLIK
ncbi:hypothetical protein AOC36_09665 [Erysipelothrix larvae]|uniref:Uncharacterized protein n=1 Tax=Erysipelothrix larvae TaxID=1514105 RepID=A0A0X8H1A3_9FIRM|nr:hypothetical protein [Erysipelothrix larvae]AMC94240.1 hypothetical protein AOC36_09665 [Erysipelothrix larvae]